MKKWLSLWLSLTILTVKKFQRIAKQHYPPEVRKDFVSQFSRNFFNRETPNDETNEFLKICITDEKSLKKMKNLEKNFENIEPNHTICSLYHFDIEHMKAHKKRTKNIFVKTWTDGNNFQKVFPESRKIQNRKN